MYTTFSVVESIPPLTSRRCRPFRPSRRRFIRFTSSRRQFTSRRHRSSSREASSLCSHSRTPSPAHEKLATFTLSSRLTKSIPVHDPHLNPPFPPFHGFCSVPISDDCWDTRTALRTHTPRIVHSILRPSGLTTIATWISAHILSELELYMT